VFVGLFLNSYFVCTISVIEEGVWRACCTTRCVRKLGRTKSLSRRSLTCTPKTSTLSLFTRPSDFAISPLCCGGPCLWPEKRRRAFRFVSPGKKIVFCWTRRLLGDQMETTKERGRCERCGTRTAGWRGTSTGSQWHAFIGGICFKEKTYALFLGSGLSGLVFVILFVLSALFQYLKCLFNPIFKSVCLFSLFHIQKCFFIRNFCLSSLHIQSVCFFSFSHSKVCVYLSFSKMFVYSFSCSKSVCGDHPFGVSYGKYEYEYLFVDMIYSEQRGAGAAILKVQRKTSYFVCFILRSGWTWRLQSAICNTF
jgi:hypothetical protein